MSPSMPYMHVIQRWEVFPVRAHLLLPYLGWGCFGARAVLCVSRVRIGSEGPYSHFPATGLEHPASPWGMAHCDATG